MNELTTRQREVYEYLSRQITHKGYWPSIREIQRAFNFKSTNAVIGHLKSLEKKGLVQRIPGQARTFRLRDIPEAKPRLPRNAIEVVEIPVMGAIAAGYPDRVESPGEIRRLQVDSLTSPSSPRRETFAVEVRGDSMIGADILEGDRVVVERREPKHGDIVAALIDEEVTLKRYCAPRDGSSPYLKAENPRYPELYPINELVIQGVAKAVVRAL